MRECLRAEQRWGCEFLRSEIEMLSVIFVGGSELDDSKDIGLFEAKMCLELESVWWVRAC